MAGEKDLRISITAIDKATEVFRTVDRNLLRLSAPLRQVGHRLSELAEAGGLRRVGEHAGEALEHVRHLGEGLLDLAGPLASLGAAGSIAGLAELTKGAAEYSETLRLAAVSTGLSAQRIAGWHYAAKLANIDVNQMDRGFQMLNRTIADAAAGHNKQAEQIFTQMGFKNAPGHLISAQQALKGLASDVQHLVAVGNTQLASSVLGKLMGQRSGMQLLPIFAKGTSGIDEEMADAKKHGLVPTPAQIAAGNAFAESWKGLDAAVTGTKNAIGYGLIPVLGPVVKWMTHWLDANRKWLANEISAAVKHLITTIKGIDWSRFSKTIRELGGAARFVARHFLAIGVAIAVIKFGPMIGELLKLGGAIVRVGVMFGTLLAANPILLAVVAAVAIVAVAAYEIYEHWGPIVKWFKGVWNSLPAPVKTALTAVGGAVKTLVMLPVTIYKNWGAIEGFFSGVWDRVTAIFGGAWNKIKTIVAALRDAMGWVGRVGGWIGNEVAAGAHAVGNFASPGSLAMPASPILSRATAAAPGAPGAKGETKVTLDFKNLPPGVTPQVETSGRPDVSANFGYAMAF